MPTAATFLVFLIICSICGGGVQYLALSTSLPCHVIYSCNIRNIHHINMNKYTIRIDLIRETHINIIIISINNILLLLLLLLLTTLLLLLLPLYCYQTQITTTIPTTKEPSLTSLTSFPHIKIKASEYMGFSPFPKPVYFADSNVTLPPKTSASTNKPLPDQRPSTESSPRALEDQQPSPPAETGSNSSSHVRLARWQRHPPSPPPPGRPPSPPPPSPEGELGQAHVPRSKGVAEGKHRRGQEHVREGHRDGAGGWEGLARPEQVLLEGEVFRQG